MTMTHDNFYSNCTAELSCPARADCFNRDVTSQTRATWKGKLKSDVESCSSHCGEAFSSTLADITLKSALKLQRWRFSSINTLQFPPNDLWSFTWPISYSEHMGSNATTNAQLSHVRPETNVTKLVLKVTLDTYV